MPRTYFGQKIIKALIRLGFYIVSTKGSHVKLRGIRFGKLQTVIVQSIKKWPMERFKVS